MLPTTTQESHEEYYARTIDYLCDADIRNLSYIIDEMSDETTIEDVRRWTHTGTESS